MTKKSPNALITEISNWISDTVAKRAIKCVINVKEYGLASIKLQLN